MIDDAHLERYEFHCASCKYTWQVTYEVRETHVGADRWSRYHYSTGVPAAPPVDGRLCPNCWQPSYEPRIVADALARGR